YVAQNRRHRPAVRASRTNTVSDGLGPDRPLRAPARIRPARRLRVQSRRCKTTPPTRTAGDWRGSVEPWFVPFRIPTNLPLGAILRHVAEYLASMNEIPVAAPVVRHRIEDVVAHFWWRRDALLQHLGHVAVTAPDGEMALRDRSIFRHNCPDPHANHR